ncbi:MAG: hypothetical protein J4469_03430 [Candidatus Aenigmarchaeota archaeon]|nr:hypothetical protein [Candidatus Aenigmarchaeota archaeon]
MGWFGKKETFGERLLKAYQENPTAYPELAGFNERDYVANVWGKVPDTDRSLPAAEILRKLIGKYAPSDWASRK